MLELTFPTFGKMASINNDKGSVNKLPPNLLYIFKIN